MKTLRLMIVFFIFFVISFTILSQENADIEDLNQDQARKICILEAANLSTNSIKIKDDQLFKTYFKENLYLEVKNAGYTIIEEALWKQKQAALKYSDVDLIEGPRAVEIGAGVGADAVIIQFYYIENNRITFGIKCYDVKTNILIVQSIKEGRAGLSISSTINEVVAEVIPRLSQEIQPFATVGKDLEKETIIEEIIKIPVIEEKGRTVKVVFSSPDNGAEIFLADEKLGVINEEKFSIDIQANRKLLLTLKKEGYHTDSRELVIGEADMEIPLQRLIKISDWGLKIEYTFFQFIGAGFGGRIYFIPDILGLDIMDYPYLQIPTTANRYLVLHNDTNFTLLLYPFFKPSWFFRMNAFIGVGVVSTFIFKNNLPAFFDFYTDIGMTLIELNFSDFLIYCRVYGRYFFDIFQSGLLGTGAASPIGAQFTLGVLLKW